MRLRTPVLPEASGDRALGHEQEADYRILIAGDSAGAGVDVETQDQALLGLLHSRLAPTHSVYLELNAMTGLTSGEVLDRMRAVTQTTFDIVIYSVGVNDVTGFTSETKWRAHIRDLAGVFQAQNADVQVIFSGLPPMYAFTALPQPLRTVMGLRAKHLNALLGKEVSTMQHCAHIDAGFLVEASMLATDGFHQGPKAYQFWASTLADHLSQHCFVKS